MKRPHDIPLPSPDEEHLTRLEACRVARIGLTTFHKAVKEKRLHISRIGRKVVVTRAELNRFMGLDQPHA